MAGDCLRVGTILRAVSGCHAHTPSLATGRRTRCLFRSATGADSKKKKNRTPERRAEHRAHPRVFVPHSVSARVATDLTRAYRGPTPSSNNPAPCVRTNSNSASSSTSGPRSTSCGCHLVWQFGQPHQPAHRILDRCFPFGRD